VILTGFVCAEWKTRWTRALLVCLDVTINILWLGRLANSFLSWSSYITLVDV